MSEPVPEYLRKLKAFQDQFFLPRRSTRTENPGKALESLRQAATRAPSEYSEYLNEAVTCYENGLYRAAILMVWAATVEHLYGVVSNHRNGFREFETHNQARYGSSNNYHRIRKKDDFLYLREQQFIQLAEDAGMINRNARELLNDRLKLRNLCGHPTQYQPGREESVVFVESLMLNVLGGAMVNW